MFSFTLLYASLNELLVGVAVVGAGSIVVDHLLEFQAYTLTVGDEILDAQVEGFETERLGEVGIGTDLISLVAVVVAHASP